MSTSVGGSLGHGETVALPGDAGHRRHATVSGMGPNRGDPGMTHGAPFWFRCTFWLRCIGAVVRRPQLWFPAVRQFLRALPARWWAQPPFLPRPDPAYLRFRFETAYGAGGRPRVDDLVRYLEWCRAGG